MKHPPLKRHSALQNLSREHHDSLIFVLRLQKGCAKKVDLEAMESYINWFWSTHLKIHFELEETELFPLLGLDHKLVLKAFEHHIQIKSLIHEAPKTHEIIERLYATLKAHIRFEERELFMHLQKELSAEQLKHFQNIHDRQLECGFWINRFWE